jgi:hypothetical protein
MRSRVLLLVWSFVTFGCSKASPSGPAVTRMQGPQLGTKSEAAAQLNAVGRKAARVYEATGKFPTGTAHTAPVATSCCAYPGKRCPVEAAAWQDPVWKALEVSIDEPTLFRYDYTANTTGEVFTAKATGDLDCDGIEIVYTLTGVSLRGVPEVHLVEPRPGAD